MEYTNREDDDDDDDDDAILPLERMEASNNMATNQTENDDDDDDEDDDDEEQVVRALAAKLAPDLQQLDTLLSSPVVVDPGTGTTRRSRTRRRRRRRLPLDPASLEQDDNDANASSSSSSSNDDDDDDEMNSEWSRLAASEQLLRQELELAENVGSLLGSPQTPTMMDRGDSRSAVWLVPTSNMTTTTKDVSASGERNHSNNDTTKHPSAIVDTPLSTPPSPGGYSSSPRHETRSSSFYTLADHAHTIGLETEANGWYSIRHANHSSSSVSLSCVAAKEYVVPLPTEELQRLYVGLVDADTTKRMTTNEGGHEDRDQDPTLQRATRTIHEHSRVEGMTTSDEVIVDTTTTRIPIVTATDASVVSIPDTTPSRANTMTSFSPDSSSVSTPPTLPVRTVVIRIRPDVLCGAVMDAMAHALMTMGAELMQRQGGRLKGIVGECVVVDKRKSGDEQYEDNPATVQLPPYLVDAQLCTFRGNGSMDHLCQRCLLLRVYHVTEQDRGIGVPVSTPCMDTEWIETSLRAMGQLHEAAAWVQHMEVSLQHSQSSSWLGGGGSKLPPLRKLRGQSSRESVQEAVSQHLLQHASPCQSVLKGNLTLPILSKEDAPVIHSSSRWIHECWHELDTRDLCHDSLQVTQFGAFPALPTLDVHFCQQLRRVCRDSMIRSLLKSAAELEQYARESEYACASLIQTLRPAFDLYGIQPPALPKPLPLTAYPLDFVPPQVTCPPWGMKVMEALNHVAAMTNEGNKVVEETDDKHVAACLSSFQMEQECVELVVFAFQRQDDEEMSCRLGRKNIQVMDRLAKMQAHKRDSIAKLRDCYDKSPRAAQAADDFYTKALQADSDFGLLSPAQHVPLFKCSVLVGSATGACYVTASHILFSTKRLPVLGHNTCTVIELKDLEFVVQDSSSSVLNPLPTSISIQRQQEDVLSFRPSYSASRLSNFLEIAQAMNTSRSGDDEEVRFSEKGGLLYLYGDSPPPKSA